VRKNVAASVFTVRLAVLKMNCQMKGRLKWNQLKSRIWSPFIDFMLVGKCIKAWATVEGQLYDICAALLKSNAALVSVVFYRTPAIGARIELVNDLFGGSLSKNKDQQSMARSESNRRVESNQETDK
jgi:hypothetical protein